MYVIYWSGTGNTEAMANAVGAGIEEAGTMLSRPARLSEKRSQSNRHDDGFGTQLSGKTAD